MKNKVTVTISDMEFTLVSEETPEYTQKLAEYVDKKIVEVSEAGGFSALAAAILTAVNISDEYFKSVDSAENMRDQIKDYFDEVSRLKDETAELRRELNRYKKDDRGINEQGG